MEKEKPFHYIIKQHKYNTIKFLGFHIFLIYKYYITLEVPYVVFKFTGSCI